MTSFAEDNYVSPEARRDFWFFCLATFLAFLSTSTISYLSVILYSLGMDEQTIGMVLSSAALPVVFGILWSGRLVAKYGALNVAVSGQIISLLAFVCFQLSPWNPLWVGACRVLLGLGFGIFFPAAMVYAKSKLRGPKTAYLFGIYSSMVPLPNILGPALAEQYFNSFGVENFFLVLAAPLLLGLILMLRLTRAGHGKSSSAEPHLGYLQLLAMRSIALPNLTILIVGMTWGFVISFMALFLRQKGIETGLFFSSCTAALIISRFFILGSLSRFPKEMVVAAGLALMAASYWILTGGQTLARVGTVVAAVTFGIGYSMAFPILSVWISDQFPSDSRAKPVALFSALFHAGIFSVPIVVGMLSRRLSLDEILLILAGGASMCAVWLTISFGRKRWLDGHPKCSNTTV